MEATTAPSLEGTEPHCIFAAACCTAAGQVRLRCCWQHPPPGGVWYLTVCSKRLKVHSLSSP
ncbi:uncharacterized protein CLUP02_03679 [Colletotrichum lupini]|uniref:Uncharacterized protein n=1 Tax=Colletotrichum lupini TaxID=145971 RepID=A0A9Q8WC16_9PEZI|nr:uncharacterized protein CLUP02_03679 [Colletotrichum lupini]UQC78203.1 hypothetical protein CLUP02_03679 [Colletotrichum lupini]